MAEITPLSIDRFLLIYLLLLIILMIMKKCKIRQSRLLLLGSLQMTVQLVLAGWLLTYIFNNAEPLYTVMYVLVMIGFTIRRVLSKNRELNKKFRLYIALTLSISGISIIVFFITCVIKENFFNPQYVIPLSGMIFGNVMTGLNLGLKTFRESIDAEGEKIEALLNFGGTPDDILRPFVSQALETALFPTLNSMVGMGIVSLPGMMTGQILAGAIPATAILYQIAIMIAIATTVCLSVFGSLYLGYRTIYNKDAQILFLRH
ncbi:MULTISPECIES: ABC transporter permease [Megasphaera]|uniref:TIGR00245 family protein n=1 Tax=Megasphaera vaginalis (ex Srinivasan et al. 2021) TaxID=1111454 RepID=U7UL55_9FIRM|nr:MULTISPECIES: ABC transporter permease [Megasphaera]ERT60041.1 TIGR00245 family protein [Megasphaera vaginalis (ex Srinivasan et al. 2021)]